MDCLKQPLVSISVIAYNSSKTIMETLDSIFNQTYPNIELIVSDDCSKDDTVEICKEWMESHKDRFVRIELLTSDKNTGVSANMNRAEKACQGEWVKPIAGDDLLLADCMETYLDYVSVHSNVKYVFGRMKVFGGTQAQNEGVEKYFSELEGFFQWTIKEQYDYLTLEKDCLPAPTAFYNRMAVERLGVVNDERIPYMEDWPKWINLLKNDVRFHFIDKVTVLYRISSDSLSTGHFSEKYIKSLSLFYILYQFRPQYQSGRKREALKHYITSKYVVEESFFWRVLNYISKRIL